MNIRTDDMPTPVISATFLGGPLAGQVRTIHMLSKRVEFRYEEQTYAYLPADKVNTEDAPHFKLAVYVLEGWEPDV